MIRTSKLLSGAILLLGVVGFLTNEAAAQRVSLQAKMASTGVDQKASGKARYEQRDKQIKFSAEAEDLSISTEISVYVEGKLIGSAKVNGAGTADLNMSQMSFQLFAGDALEIRNQDGKPILRGVLQERKTGPIGPKK